MKSHKISTHASSNGFTSDADKALETAVAVATSSGSKPAWSLRMQGGFTLMEVIVTMGIFAVVIGMGLYFGLDDYRAYLFRSEVDTVVNILQKARNEAMNNIGEMPHGVHISDEAYVLFAEPEGEAYDEDNDTNQSFPRNPTIMVTGGTDIIFEQLTGDVVNNVALTMSDGSRVRSIEITEDGRINW